MTEASGSLLKLSRQLFTDEETRQAFVAALLHPQAFHPCIVWCHDLEHGGEEAPFVPEAPLPWQPGEVDRLAIGVRPGAHPLHQQGYFYCLDFSSVFATSVLQAIASPVATILDLCAAPGGKSILAWRRFRPSQLICNEVIGKRTAALISNLQRCRIEPYQVCRLDASVWASRSPQSFDLVLVDAPCSGQSLLAKGDKAPGCFHPVTINKNANRQKRILANAAQTVAVGGFLAYMTCTYSPQENEAVVAWLLDRFPQFQPVEVSQLAAFQSHLTSQFCYRMWPHHRLGAGAFTCLLRHKN